METLREGRPKERYTRSWVTRVLPYRGTLGPDREKAAVSSLHDATAQWSPSLFGSCSERVILVPSEGPLPVEPVRDHLPPTRSLPPHPSR